MRVVRQSVTVRFAYEGLHCWPEAPREVAFLSSMHRHAFHAEVTVPVDHGDRDVEFILLQRYLKGVAELWGLHLGRASCEQQAMLLAAHAIRFAANDPDLDLPAYPEEVGREGENLPVLPAGWTATASVWEDGENGATVEVAS